MSGRIVVVRNGIRAHFDSAATEEQIDATFDTLEKFRATLSLSDPAPFACTQCGAAPGERCMLPSGREIPGWHSPRRAAAGGSR